MCTTALPGAPSPSKGGTANQAAPPRAGILRSPRFRDSARRSLSPGPDAGRGARRGQVLRARWPPCGRCGRDGHRGLTAPDRRGRGDGSKGSPGRPVLHGAPMIGQPGLPRSPARETPRRASGGGGRGDGVSLRALSGCGATGSEAPQDQSRFVQGVGSRRHTREAGSGGSRWGAREASGEAGSPEKGVPGVPAAGSQQTHGGRLAHSRSSALIAPTAKSS